LKPGDPPFFFVAAIEVLLTFYTLKSENLFLTLYEVFSKNLPSPRGEGMKGRGDQTVFILFTPTLALPHQKGGGDYWGNFRYFGLGLILGHRAV
jgi:hypothetical protein